MAKEYTKEVQQELMERSLRNVRGLVEKIEAEEAARKRTQKWVIGTIVAVSLILVGMIALMVSRQPSGKPMIISPDTASQVPASAPRK